MARASTSTATYVKSKQNKTKKKEEEEEDEEDASCKLQRRSLDPPDGTRRLDVATDEIRMGSCDAAASSSGTASSRLGGMQDGAPRKASAILTNSITCGGCTALFSTKSLQNASQKSWS